MFLPTQADSSGFGPAVEREVEEWIRRECASDSWLAEHPPVVVWEPNSVMAMEIPESEPIVGTVCDAAGTVGRPSRLAGLDSWYDGATFTRLAGTPSIAFGPSGLTLGERPVGHTVDEFVPVDKLSGLVAAQRSHVAAGDSH